MLHPYTLFACHTGEKDEISDLSSRYAWNNWFWLIGAACPAIQWFFARKYPRSILRYIYFPAIFGAAAMIPPATTWWLGQWVLVGLTFNWIIKKYYFGWWSMCS
jgi:hypothetical protein